MDPARSLPSQRACFIRGTVKQVAIGGGNYEIQSRDHWNQRCILGSLCHHLHGAHNPVAGTGPICSATQGPGALSRLCRRKAALVHLVSRKGLRRLAGARRKVHLSAGQHVHELQTAARGCEVKRDEFSRILGPRVAGAAEEFSAVAGRK